MAVAHIDRHDTDAHDTDRHRFDPRVAPWEKNKAREGLIMSFAAALLLPLASPYRSGVSHPATNEPTPTPRNPYQLHHAAVHV
jgi:hypothetical protein